MQVVQCALADNGVRMVQSELAPEELLACFQQSRTEPQVFLILEPSPDGGGQAGEINLLQWAGTHFQLRTAQNASKSLSACLLGRDERPAIQAKYTRVSTCSNAIERLLQEARFRPEAPRAFLILLNPKLFAGLWTQAGVASAPRSPTRTAHKNLGILDDALCEQILLERSSHPPVPDKLKQWYLGKSDKIELVRRLILRAGKVDSPALIIGESGTGKERVARAIHDYGRRKTLNFVPANCAAIPSELFESELFGHVKGAFTGAVRDRLGLWRQAGDGTLFLDEIGDLTPSHQAKILRALQEGEVRPVGSEKTYPVKARIITATNRDLKAMIQAGTFREDLYYRLSGFPIPVPALREHPDDIPLLTRHFWAEIAGQKPPALPREALVELKRVDWPGNVRELRAFLHHLHGIAAGEEPDLSLVRTVLYQRRVPLRLRAPGT